MLAIAVFLLGLLAFLHTQGPVSNALAVILSVLAMILAVLSFVGVPPAIPGRWHRGP